jgi:hypothetical protein
MMPSGGTDAILLCGSLRQLCALCGFAIFYREGRKGFAKERKETHVPS